MKKNRHINFEILRIISMFMIIFLHIIVHGRVREEVDFLTVNYILVWFLLACCYTSVNCFVLISGYFMVKLNFKIKKLIKLWGKIWFYSLSIFIIFLCFNKSIIRPIDYIKSILPIITGSYWFATTYILLYIISPILNKIILKSDKKKLLIIIFVMFVLFSILPTIMPSIYSKITGGGQGIFWFATLYFIGGYYRLYVNPDKIKRNRCLIGYFLISLFAVVCRIGIVIILKKDPLDFGLIWRIYGNNTIFILTASIFLFSFFASNKSINISEKLKHNIIKMSSLMFVVYLIHDNYLIREWFWSLFEPSRWATKPYLIVVMFGICIFVMISCMLIEMIRKLIVNKIDNIIVRLKQAIN